MGIEQNFVIYVTNILDCVNEITMKSGAMASQITLLDLPGIYSVIC